MRNRVRFATIVLASSFTAINNTINQAPALAQRTQNQEEAAQCTTALRTARSRISKSRKVTITGIKKTDTPQGYQDYPPNRPSGYLFLLKGTDAPSVLLSSKLLDPISADIIKNCTSVSIVEFQLDEPTAFVTTIGLVGQGRVEAFTKCGNPEAQKLPWGSVICV
jgi:hypothetical protein